MKIFKEIIVFLLQMIGVIVVIGIFLFFMYPEVLLKIWHVKWMDIIFINQFVSSPLLTIITFIIIGLVIGIGVIIKLFKSHRK